MRLFCVPWAALAVWMGYLAAGTGTRIPSTGEWVPTPVGERVLFGALALGFAWLAWRTWRIGVYAGPDGVRVQNVLRSHTVRWGDIETFAEGRQAGFPAGCVQLRGGGRLVATSLNPPLGPDRGVPRLLAGLNEELGRRRAVTPGA